MTATLEDLRAALRESAEQSSCPDPSLTLAEVARGVAQAERRRRGEVAAVAAAVLVLGSGFLAWDDGRARAPVHLASVVTDDPAFPAYERGLKRLTILDLPLAEGARAVVSTREREKNLLHIVAYCAGADVSGELLSVTSGGRQKYVPCRSAAQASTPSGIPVLWRPDDAGDQLLLQPTRRTRGGGHATIAVYQEVGWDDYRFPPRPHDLETSPHTAWTARGGTPVYRGPLDASRPNAPLAVTVPYEKGMRVRLHARAPGALRVTVNGRFLTLYCVGPVGPAVCGSPSGKTFTQWGYGAAEAGNWLDAASPGLRPGQKVTITAYPSSFAGDDWRLEVGRRKR